MQKHDNAQDFAWDSFSKTGKIGYYLFYRALQMYKDGTESKGNSDSQN